MSRRGAVCCRPQNGSFIVFVFQYLFFFSCDGGGETIREVLDKYDTRVKYDRFLFVIICQLESSFQNDFALTCLIYFDHEKVEDFGDDDINNYWGCGFIMFSFNFPAVGIQ